MPRPYRVPAAALDLVQAYLTGFTRAGFLAVGSAEDGARAFCARFGSTAGWTAGEAPTSLDGDVLVRLRGLGDQASTALPKARLLETVREYAYELLGPRRDGVESQLLD